MASKSAHNEPVKTELIEELLDVLDTALDRVKVLYEQFFLGMQKQPPAHLHTDVERKLRDLTQMQIRNTAQRYRFATLQQKFGSYNSYWRRTLRQIENGTYLRNLSKLSRQAAATGEEIPEEILAAMPKRMREQVKRDREAAVALAKRRDKLAPESATSPEDAAPAAAVGRKTRGGAHIVEADDDFDLDAYFASVTNEATAARRAPDDPDGATTRVPVFPDAPDTTRMPAVSNAPATTRMPTFADAPATTRIPTVAARPAIARPIAPSQQVRPVPVTPGAASGRTTPVETLAGPFPRPPSPSPRSPSSAAPPARTAPPPGMTDADVNALYAKYVQAKQAIGEPTGPGAYGKLVKTITAQAPKIMEQYKAKGVDFQVVVKDNQVVIRAKPKP